MKNPARLWACAACLAASMATAPGHAVEPALFQGSVYEYVPTYTTWHEARAQAEAMSFMSFPDAG